MSKKTHPCLRCFLKDSTKDTDLCKLGCETRLKAIHGIYIDPPEEQPVNKLYIDCLERNRNVEKYNDIAVNLGYSDEYAMFNYLYWGKKLSLSKVREVTGLAVSTINERMKFLKISRRDIGRKSGSKNKH